MLATLLLSTCTLLPADDSVPVAIEALLAAPQDRVFTGVQDLLPATTLWARQDQAAARCLLSLPDITGDGVPETALGLGPASGAKRPLRVLDGATGELVWSAPAGAGFRSLRGLAERDGRLAAAACTRGGRLRVHDSVTGDLLWSRLLAPRTPELVTLHSVLWLEDLSGDEIPELLVTAGGGGNRAALLSGADGVPLWEHLTDEVVYDARPTEDIDADGWPEIAIVGGETAPFARLLHGVDGTPIWSVPLDGPGSVVLPLDDRHGDGWPEIVVGQFAEPEPCLLYLNGADGARIWESAGLTRGVTTLIALQDLADTGLRDIGVGSFDNGFSGVLALNGFSQWRRETSTNNGGQVLSIARVGDLDGNGFDDVVGAGMDNRVWVVEGRIGQYMAAVETFARVHVVARDVDRNGDGRPEYLASDGRVTRLVDGAGGLASGPLTEAAQGKDLIEPVILTQWTLPSTRLLVFVGLAPAQPALPTKYGAFGLDPTTMILFLDGTAPGAGVANLILPGLPPVASGWRLFFQSASLYPGVDHGLLSPVTSALVP